MTPQPLQVNNKAMANNEADDWIEVHKLNATLNESQKIRTFATHGNSTIFFYYSGELMDIAAVCFIVFAVIGVIGNSLSILALSRSVKLRNATTAFIINLCVADLLFCCFSMPLSAITFLERDWNYGPYLCKLFPLVRYSNGAVSLFSVIAITINRYVLIVHPGLYRGMYRPCSIGVMILLMWVCALALLLFPFFEVWGKFGFDQKVGTCTILEMNGLSPKMFYYIVAFTIPSVIFIFCYSRIFWVVRRSSKQIRKEIRKMSPMSNLVKFSSKMGVFLKEYRHSEMPKCIILQPQQKKAELKVLKIILAIFITFILCYFPISFVKIFKKEDHLPVLNIIGYLAVYFSNIINPVIYVVMSDEYRKAYKELFCSKPKIYLSAERIYERQMI